MAEIDFEGFWKETLSQLQAKLGEAEFSGWFTDIRYIRAGEDRIYIGFPSGFHRDSVKTRYEKIIQTMLKEHAGRDIALEYEVVSDAGAAKNPAPAKNPAGNDQNINESQDASSVKPKKKQHPQMRDDYTFEKYIVGENNKFAANAAIAISRNPGKVYNPFLIYGGVGLGKTHLMQAIGNYVHENSDNKVVCITSEDFLNEYMEGIKHGKMNSFKNKFRNADVLLIDDIQFFQDKPGVQEELFHTFNALLNAQKHLVFTCDRPPSTLKKFSERLLSRFEQSLKVDLQPPRYEVRCVILKKTAESRGASIPDEVIDFISKNVSSNIRDLIGTLNTLIAFTEIMKQPVTLEIAQKTIISTRQANLSIEAVQKAVADFFSLSINDLKGKKRNQKVVYPRQIAMYICREMTDYTHTEIGENFGGRDHTTVMHSIEKIRNIIITDPALDTTIESLKRQIKESSAKS